MYGQTQGETASRLKVERQRGVMMKEINYREPKRVKFRVKKIQIERERERDKEGKIESEREREREKQRANNKCKQTTGHKTC